MKLNPSFDYYPFVSDESKEEAVYELLERTPTIHSFCGVNFGPQILNVPLNQHFDAYSADLFSDYAIAKESQFKVYEGLPEDHPYILLRADKSTPATLYQIENIRLLNPKAEIWVIGENSLGIKGQQKKIEREIGPTETHTVAASCRLFQVFPKNQTPDPQKYLCSVSTESLKETEFETLKTFPGVFSLKKVDKGSQLLLDSIKNYNFNGQKILDFGCGCGILSTYVLKHGAGSVTSADLSLMAVKNTRFQTENTSFKDQHSALWSCLESEVNENDFDIIITNPPFHLKQSLRTDFTDIWLKACASRLKKDGALILVYNRLLGYDEKAKAHFKKVKVIGESKEFIVIQALKC
jgi:16S rRNA (guanine1207-N2)-methyltransferase